MKLFLLTICLSLIASSLCTERFPHHQLRIKNYLNRKPVKVEVSNSHSKYSFDSFISRNSRGVLLEITSPDVLKKDKTGFFKQVTIENKEHVEKQVLLDFRLINMCRFINRAKVRNPKTVSLEFEITNRGTKMTTTFTVKIMFKGLTRNELLVNDAREFKDALKQLRNSCQTRKNQLKNRRDWFIQKGDELYDHVKKLTNAEHQKSKFLDPRSPYNIDSLQALTLKSHARVTERYRSLRKKAKELATLNGGLESQALQFEKERADDSRALVNARKEIEQGKEQVELAKRELHEAASCLKKKIPEARKLIQRAEKKANQKDHQNEALKLAINS